MLALSLLKKEFELSKLQASIAKVGAQHLQSGDVTEVIVRLVGIFIVILTVVMFYMFRSSKCNLLLHLLYNCICFKLKLVLINH